MDWTLGKAECPECLVYDILDGKIGYCSPMTYAFEQTVNSLAKKTFVS